MAEDLRSFINRLRREKRLAAVSKTVDPNLEISAVMKKADRAGRAILFKNAGGTRFPVINNLLASRDILARLFETNPQDTVKEFIKRIRNPLTPALVSSAPLKDVILPENQVDLSILPIVTHQGKDAGPFITAGLITAKDPDTGIRNVSVNRMQLKGRNKLGIRMMPPQHLGVIFEKYEKAGRNMEIAVAIGNHPFDIMAAATSVDFGVDEYTVAGALRREPLELVPCETVDLEVPASAEIVLEGEVLSGIREDEGPFGDFMQYYVPIMRNNIFIVKAITYRQDAIYQTIQAGSVEDTMYLGLSREARIYNAVSPIADVRTVALAPTILGGAVAISKRSEDEPKKVLAAAFEAYNWLKYCVVVDADVDVFNSDDVWWAVATRCRPEDGLLQINDTGGFPRDPFERHTSKIGIDATAPLNQWSEFERISVPGFETVSLEDYLDRA